MVAATIRKKTGVACQPEDLAMVSIKISHPSPSTQKTSSPSLSRSSSSAKLSVGAAAEDPFASTTATALVKFRSRRLREQVFEARAQARRGGLQVEEQLTSTRSKVLARCRELYKKQQGSSVLLEVFTRRGNVFVAVAKHILQPKPGRGASLGFRKNQKRGATSKGKKKQIGKSALV